MTEQMSAEIDQFARVALVARALTAALHESEVVDIVVRQGMAGLDAEGGVLAFLEGERFIVPAVTVGYSQEAISAFSPLTIDLELPLTAAARMREPIFVPSRVEAAARFPALVANSVTGSQAWAAIPLVADGSVIGVLAVSFLAPREFSEAERMFIRALADVCALALDGRRSETSVASLCDRVVNRVFASARHLSTIPSLRSFDEDGARRVSDAIDELDLAVREIRNAALGWAVAHRIAPVDSTRGVARAAVPDIPSAVLRAGHVGQRRQLCRFHDGNVFAYAVQGHDFYRAIDHELWARESGDLLLSARSGVQLARRVGKAFFEIDSGVPLYYERAR